MPRRIKKIVVNEPTAKQKMFMQNYTNPDSSTYLNATAAYREAYKCSQKTAKNLGSRTLQKPHIQASLKDLLDTNQFKTLLVNGLRKRLSDPDSRYWGQASELFTKILGAYIERHEIYKGVDPAEAERQELEFLEKVRRAEGSVTVAAEPVSEEGD